MRAQADTKVVQSTKLESVYSIVMMDMQVGLGQVPNQIPNLKVDRN